MTLPRTPNVKEIVEEFKAYVDSKKANQASSKPTYVLTSIKLSRPLTPIEPLQEI